MVPNSQFVVSRTAFPDNSSKYHVGSKAVSRGEVVDLLKQHGIDLDNNRFLILQGEVEHIATMKPKSANPGDDNGLLEYLEDIIGSNRFVEPIADATKELEVLSVERTRRLNRLRIVEKEKIQLEASKVQAEEHIAKQKTVYDKKAILYQHERLRVLLESEDVESKHHELLTAQAEQKKSMEARESEVRELEANVAAQAKLVAVASKKLEKVKAKLKAFENEDVTLQEQMKTLSAKQKKLEKTIKSESDKVEEKDALIVQLNGEREELEHKIAESEQVLQEQEEKLTKERQRMSSVLAPLHEEMSIKQRELMPFKETVGQCEAKLELLRSKLESQAKRAVDSRAQYEAAEAQVVELKKKLEGAAKETLRRNEEELEEKTTALAQAEEEVRTLKQKDAELSQQVITTRSQIEEAARTKTSSGLLANLRKLIPQSVSSGILGKLGELGTIDEKYDTAVTTACGALENIVVTTAEVAQQCVEVLKAKRLGRATFIILHEIRELVEASKAKIQVPAGAQRLFDLVAADSDEARVAFYHALSDTLVCEDLDTASSLAFGKKRWRVVTTSGALFDFAGTISGGGAHKASGGMRVTKAGQAKASSSSSSSSSSSALDANVLKQQLEKLSAQLSSVRSELQRAEGAVAQLKNACARLKRQVDMARAERESVEKQVATLAASARELCEEAERREAEKKEAEKSSAKELSAAEKALASARADAEAGERAVAALKRLIEEASGEALRKAEQAHASLQAQVDEWSTTLTKHGVQVASAEKASAKAKEACERAREEQKTTEGEVGKAREALRALTENALAATQLLDEAAALYGEEAAKHKQLEEECEQRKAETIGSKESAFKGEEKLKQVEAQLKEQRELVRTLNAKLEEVAKKKAELRVDETESVEDPQQLGIAQMSDEELEALDDRELKAIKLEMHKLAAELEGNILNTQTILDYREKLKVYMEHKAEVDDINSQFDAKHQQLDSLRKQRLDCFMEGHSKINPKLKEMYTMITISGSADLEISNSTDPFLDGITFSVRPPNKSWRPIQNLSGGEKTLSSLALVFALHYYKPTPLYVMDEIDAALDFKNVSIVANYIKERTKDAQFLIVSLRNFMFELADRLVGIYKTDNATKSVTINPSSFVLPASSSSDSRH